MDEVLYLVTLKPVAVGHGDSGAQEAVILPAVLTLGQAPRLPGEQPVLNLRVIGLSCRRQ